MANEDWNYEEIKDKQGRITSYVYTSKLNDDITLSIFSGSVKIEGGTATYIMEGPQKEVYEGWFIRLKNAGEFSSFVGVTVNERREMPRELAIKLGVSNPPENMKTIFMQYPPEWRGPWDIGVALDIVRHLLNDPQFNAHYNVPKKYSLHITGWETEEFLPLGIRWTSNLDGRHMLILKATDWDKTFTLTHHVGYADDPPETKREDVILEDIHGKSLAIKATREYAEELVIPLGALEKQLSFLKDPRFAEQLKSMKPNELEALVQIKTGAIGPDAAVRERAQARASPDIAYKDSHEQREVIEMINYPVHYRRTMPAVRHRALVPRPRRVNETSIDIEAGIRELQKSGFKHVPAPDEIGFYDLTEIEAEIVPDAKKLADIKERIRKFGIKGIPPIALYRDDTLQLRLIDGGHRLLAFEELGIPDIQAIVYSASSIEGPKWLGVKS